MGEVNVTRVTRVLGLLVPMVLLSCTILAQDALVFGNPEYFCRNGAFPGGGEYPGPRPVFKLAQLTGPKGARIHFLADDDGLATAGDCPRADNPKCVMGHYLVPGDRVIVSKTYRNLACSWYQPRRGPAQRRANRQRLAGRPRHPLTPEAGFK